MGLTTYGRCGLVLSGINEGGNLGADFYHAGTVGRRPRRGLSRPGRSSQVCTIARRICLSIGSKAADWIAPILRDLIARPLACRGFGISNPAASLTGQSGPGSGFLAHSIPRHCPSGFVQEGKDIGITIGDSHSRGGRARPPT